MTVLCDVEEIVYKTPLIYISEETDKFIPLTPSILLQDIEENDVLYLDTTDSKILQSCYRRSPNIRQQLRNRFKKEYLAEIVHKSKDKRQVEVVFIKKTA